VDGSPVQKAVDAFTRICTYDRTGYAWSDRRTLDGGITEIVDDLFGLRNATI
jgi:hypothetical protein